MFNARTLVAALCFSALPGPAGSQTAEPENATTAEAPLDKVDRSRIIGAPVLDQAPRGIHLWLEDGWYHLAAVTALPAKAKVPRKQTFTVTVRSTKPITSVDLERWTQANGGMEQVTLQVVAGADPERMRFKTEGELTLSESRDEGDGTRVPIFVGPLSRPAARSVRVGRF